MSNYRYKAFKKLNTDAILDLNCFYQFVGLAKLLRKMISLSGIYKNITTFLKRSQLDIIKVIYTPFDFTNLIIVCILQYVAQKILKNEHHH